MNAQIPAPTGAAIDERVQQFESFVRQGISVSASALRVGVTPSTGVRWAIVLGIKFPRRLKTLTESKLAAARALLRCGIQKAEVASKVVISQYSVSRILSSEPALAKKWRTSQFNQRRSSDRQRFLDALRRQPNRKLAQVRRAQPATYAWLYRNDRDWLRAQVQSLHIRTNEGCVL